MKNKTGKISGFLFGMIGFLWMYKLIFLVKIPPDDELAPGAVLIMSILNGFVVGFIGSVIQNYLTKKSKNADQNKIVG